MKPIEQKEYDARRIAHIREAILDQIDRMYDYETPAVRGITSYDEDLDWLKKLERRLQYEVQNSH